MADLLIDGGFLVSEGLESVPGYILVRGDRIAEIGTGKYAGQFSGERIDASGKLVMPGVIDDQVHFRDPGLTYKGDMHSESIAAVAGGVTSFMDMPNTKPPATTLGLLEQKFEIASEASVANYSFYLGATNDNLDEIKRADPTRVAGVKVFMGSSTGNMLVDDDRALSAIFAESPLIIATHCEDETIIRENAEKFRRKYGDNIQPQMHPLIRSAEACYRSSAKAVELADKYGSQLHVLHLSTARELSLFQIKPLKDKKITSEVCVHHLWFTDADYATKGNLIKWNPAVKSASDAQALWYGLITGKVDIIATDHAPHTLEEKQRPYWECPSGGPMVQHSLVAMLEKCRAEFHGPNDVAEKMAHAPAIRFGIKDRGFLRPGYYADIVIVDYESPWTVSRENILYKCGWSPMEGETFRHRVVRTIINGHTVYDGERVDISFRGSPLEFS